MSKLDVAKEQIAYLKFWLGIMAIIDISLVGWLVSSTADAHWLKPLAALAAIVAVTLAGWGLHLQIQRRIDALEEL
jgi:hypothetical protein